MITQKTINKIELPKHIQIARSLIKFRAIRTTDNRYNVYIDVGISGKVQLFQIGQVFKTTKGSWVVEPFFKHTTGTQRGKFTEYLSNDVSPYLKASGYFWTKEIAVFKNRHQAGQALISYWYNDYQSIQNVCLNYIVE